MDRKILGGFVLAALIPVYGCAQTAQEPAADASATESNATLPSTSGSSLPSPAAGSPTPSSGTVAAPVDTGATQASPAYQLGEEVRGSTPSGTPPASDRAVSRTWDGLGSTGGATGTGESSGTIAEDLPPAAPR